MSTETNDEGRSSMTGLQGFMCCCAALAFAASAASAASTLSLWAFSALAGKSGCDHLFFFSVFFCCKEKLFEADAMLSAECRPEDISSLAERNAGGLSSVKLAECL
jgi:hypothetical protein